MTPQGEEGRMEAGAQLDALSSPIVDPRKESNA
jgi:hypothetical protein